MTWFYLYRYSNINLVHIMLKNAKWSITFHPIEVGKSKCNLTSSALNGFKWSATVISRKSDKEANGQSLTVRHTSLFNWTLFWTRISFPFATKTYLKTAKTTITPPKQVRKNACNSSDKTILLTLVGRCHIIVIFLIYLYLIKQLMLICFSLCSMENYLNRVFSN